MKNRRSKLLSWSLASSVFLGSSLIPTVTENTQLEASEFFLKRFFGGEVRNSLEAGHKAYRQGEFKKASQIYYKRAMEDRKNHEAWYHLGLSYQQVKAFDLAANAFQMAVQIEDDIVEYKYHLSFALVQSGHVRPALKKLRYVLKDHAKHDMSWTLLGRCYESLGQLGQAKSAYLQALNIDPQQGQALFLLERLDGKLKPLPLYLGEQERDPNTHSEPEVMGKMEGPIPTSRVISALPERDNAKSKSGHLSPILQSYHLNRDAHIKGLSPSPVQVWNKPSPKDEQDQSNTETIPSPKNTAPVDLPPPSLDISTEDL